MFKSKYVIRQNNKMIQYLINIKFLSILNIQALHYLNTMETVFDCSLSVQVHLAMSETFQT